MVFFLISTSMLVHFTIFKIRISDSHGGSHFVKIIIDVSTMALQDIAPLSDLLAKNGSLNIICSYLSHQELLQIRLVSRSWARVATSQRRVQRSIGKFGTSWHLRLGNYRIPHAHRWHGAHFKNMFFLESSRVFKDYWALQRANLRVLKLSGIRVACDLVFHFINIHPLLEEVFFCRNNFVLQDFTREVRQLIGLEHLPRRVQNCKTMCPHHNGMTDVLGENAPLHPPTIHSITLKNQITFPLCILDALDIRSRGRLRQFCIKDSVRAQDLREVYFPADNLLTARFITIITHNHEVLESYKIYNHTSACKFVEAIHANTVRLQFPSLREVVIDDLQSQVANRQRFNHNFELERNFREFVFRLPLHLEKFKIRVNIGLLPWDPIIISLSKLKQLKSLTLFMGQGHLRRNLVLRAIQEWPLLEELDYEEFGRRVEIDIMRTVRQWCPMIRKLRVAFKTCELREVVNFGLLRSLSIHKAARMTRAEFRLIVGNLPLLEEFKLKSCEVITDSVLCGISEKTCDELRNAQTPEERYRIGKFAMFNAKRRNIPRLTSLIKLKNLEIQYCMITDITLCFGIAFPFLRSLDLTFCPNITDYGMSSLGKNNPILERVVLLQTKHITRNGINELIFARPTLVDVHTKHSNTKQFRAGEVNVDHPGFDRIVSIAEKNKVKAPPLHEL